MSSNTHESSAARLLLEQHMSHNATVEDGSDDEARPQPAAASETPGHETMAAPSTSRSPSRAPSAATKPAETNYSELFPEFGGGASKVAAPVWPARAGKTIGAVPSNSTSQLSSPEPVSQGLDSSVAPKLSIPGQHQERYILPAGELLPPAQMKRPLADIVKDFNRKSRAQIKVKPHPDDMVMIEATGPKGEATTKSLKDFVALIGAKVKLEVDIPRWARPHIIGKSGTTIKAIEERTGARVHVPKDDGRTTANDENDDEAVIQVMLEGNSQQVAHAQDIIHRIVGESGGQVETSLKGIPAEFYPFIAGPSNSNVNRIEQEKGVKIRVPRAHPLSSTPPVVSAQSGAPVWTPAEASFIRLAGDRNAVKAARLEIEQHAQELRNQLTVKVIDLPPGRHQFIIGDKGVSMDQFFEETGCTIVFPNDEDDDAVKIIGYPHQAAAGVEKAADLGMDMQCSNVDVSRFYRQAPGGAAVHARYFTRYLQQKRELERVGKEYNVYFNTPFSEQGALPWELYSRDGKNIIRAQSEIKALADAYPPARMATVSVDPFYHQHIKKEVLPHVQQNFGVHLVIPDAAEANAPVLLVYEGASSPDSSQVARSQPSQSEISEMQKRLRDAQSYLNDLMSQREPVSATSIEVPVK